MTTTNGPVIDRSIYLMPVFLTLVVSDLAAVADAIRAAEGHVTGEFEPPIHTVRGERPH